nr:hypothetical protein [Labilibaculum filiforme]
MNVSSFYWKNGNEEQTCKSGILFQYPVGGIVAMVTMFLYITLLLFYYFIVGSENEDHIAILISPIRGLG